MFNPNVAYDGHAAELGSLLKIDKEIAKDVKSDFSFQVEEITRFVPGELTQEVFDQAFGEGVVKTEEEFRAKIKEEIAARFVADSDYKFLIDIRKVMMEKVGKLEFSDALLKRIMLLNNEETVSYTHLRTDGKGLPFLHMKAGGSVCPPSYFTVDNKMHYLHQEGRTVFKLSLIHI